MIALGELASQIKINQSSALPGILSSEIKELVDIYTDILREKARQEKQAAEAKAREDAANNPTPPPIQKFGVNDTLIASDPTRYGSDKTVAKGLINDDSVVPAIYRSTPNLDAFRKKNPTYIPSAIANFGVANASALQAEYQKAEKLDDQIIGDNYDKFGDVIYNYSNNPPAGTPALGKGLYSKKFGVYIPTEQSNNSKFISKVVLDGTALKDAFSFFDTYSKNKFWKDSDDNFVYRLQDEFVKKQASRLYVAWFFSSLGSSKIRVPLQLQFRIPAVDYPDGTNEPLLILRKIIDDFIKGSDKEIAISKFNYSINNRAEAQTITFPVSKVNDKIPDSLNIKTSKNGYNSRFAATGEISMSTITNGEQDVVSGTTVTTQQTQTASSEKIDWTLTFWDSSFIKDIQPANGQGYIASINQPTTTAQAAGTTAANAEEEIKLDAEAIQTQENLNYQSGLEVFLRAIQLHSFNIAYKDLGVKEGKIATIDLYSKKSKFIKDLFSNGVLSQAALDFADSQKIKAYKNTYNENDAIKLMQSYASYGFNHNLMAQSKNRQQNIISDKDSKIPQVDFKELYKSHVVPYSVNQGIAKDIDINYPVYIKFGLLLLALNHMCTIYDSKEGKITKIADQTPLIYIDFNPETNFCLSEPLQLSTDPLKMLIPFRGTNDEYSKLFDPKLITKDGKIKATSGSAEKDLFKPQTEDYISSQLPSFKGINPDAGDAYSGKIMNILLSCDYLLSLCKNFANSDQNQSVKLRPFLQQIIDDINKYLGGINLLRLAYDDKSNCLYIVDDQVQPMKLDEKSVPEISTNSVIPVFGKYSIARSLEIRTDISSKLSNMIAISANSDIKSDASKDGTPFGHYNDNYSDRFIPQVLSVNSSDTSKKNNQRSDPNDAEISAAIAFNEFIRCALNTGQISDMNVSAATNYYIDRMNKRKGENPGTESSAMIPISVNFSTDGISGLAMGHAFLLPEAVMPASYQRRSDSNSQSVIGFVITGLNHSLQNNIWITEVKANMMFLKEKAAFKAEKTSYNVAQLSTGNFVIVEDDGNDTDIVNIDPVGGSGVKGDDFKVNPTYKSLIAAAKASVGTSTAAIPGTENGNIGCGAGTSIIFLRATGKGIVPPGDLCLGTAAIGSHLGKDSANWRARSNWLDAKPGDIIVTERGSKAGHVGVVIDTIHADGSYTVISNSSGGFRGAKKGTIQPNYTVKKWASIATRNPTRTFAYEYIGSFS
jgi:hypothetical protein